MNASREGDASRLGTDGEEVAYHDDEEVAYHDGEATCRDDGGFRPGAGAGVDIEPPSLGGIGYAEQAERDDYTVDAEPGRDALSAVVTSDPDSELRVTVDGRRVGTVTRDTGGWYNFGRVKVDEFTVDGVGECVIRIEQPGLPLDLDLLVVETSCPHASTTIEFVHVSVRFVPTAGQYGLDRAS